MTTKASLQNELTLYNNYEDKVENFKDGLSKAYNYLVSSENEMKKGFYDDNNKTLDRGVLKNSYDLLDEIMGDIDSLVLKIQSEKRSISSKISEITRQEAAAKRKKGLTSTTNTTSSFKKKPHR